MPPHLTETFAVREDLIRERSIPQALWPTLERRLAIAFIPWTRHARTKERLTQQQRQERFRHKKAQEVYLGVLDRDVSLFIPFLLAVSPRKCEIVDVKAIRQGVEQQVKIIFNAATKAQLGEIAARLRFDENRAFKRLLEWLFPNGNCSASLSA